MKKTFTKNKKGFTLIELLVVIAIIGILSSIVIASLNDARNKSADAALRKSLQEFYKKTQEYAVDNNLIYASTYTGGSWGPIDSAPDVLPGTSSIVKNIADNSISFTHSIHGTIKGFYLTGNSYHLIMIVAKSKNGDYLCVDTLPSSSNKIYKVRSAVTSGGPANNGCVYWE